jgi:RNA polymerase sigma factor (sigma-70 family)
MQVQNFAYKEYAELTDGVLAQRAYNGDQSAFEMLVKRYNTSLFRFIYHFLKDYDLAGDILQQVFLQLYLSLPNLHASMPLKAWLFRVARNRCVDEIRRRNRHKTMLFSELEVMQPDLEEQPIFVDMPDPDPLPEELTEHKDTQQYIQKAIDALPPKFRGVVLLRYASQLSFSEISRVLDIPIPTAKTYFQRAKPLLRASLEKQLQVLPA